MYIASALYIVKLKIIHIDSKKIKQLSVKVNIKPARSFIKPTVLVFFTIFTPFS